MPEQGAPGMEDLEARTGRRPRAPVAVHEPGQEGAGGPAAGTWAERGRRMLNAEAASRRTQ